MEQPICGYCHEPLDTLDLITCPGCGLLFCGEGCRYTHYRVGYHLGDEYYNDHVRRPMMGPYTYQQVDYSEAWIPAQEPEEWHTDQ